MKEQQHLELVAAVKSIRGGLQGLMIILVSLAIAVGLLTMALGLIHVLA